MLRLQPIVASERERAAARFTEPLGVTVQQVLTAMEPIDELGGAQAPTRNETVVNMTTADHEWESDASVTDYEGNDVEESESSTSAESDL
jgi:hypothetical protein